MIAIDCECFQVWRFLHSSFEGRNDSITRISVLTSNMKIANRTFIVSGGSSGLATIIYIYWPARVACLHFNYWPQAATRGLRTIFHSCQILSDWHHEIEKAVEGTVAWTKETGVALGGVVNCAGVGVASKVTSPSKRGITNSKPKSNGRQ